MYALGFRDSSVMRVLSPSRDPPVVEDEGSTANTATWCFLLVRKVPNVSINVDLPPPGGPDNPILKEQCRAFENGGACFEYFTTLASSFCAWWYLLGWSVSTSVIAWAKLPRSPRIIPWNKRWIRWLSPADFASERVAIFLLTATGGKHVEMRVEPLKTKRHDISNFLRFRHFGLSLIGQTGKAWGESRLVTQSFVITYEACVGGQHPAILHVGDNI